MELLRTIGNYAISVGIIYSWFIAPAAILGFIGYLTYSEIKDKRRRPSQYAFGFDGETGNITGFYKTDTRTR